MSFESTPKSTLEMVISRLASKTVSLMPDGGGGIPEFTAGDIAAACAGLTDRLASEIDHIAHEDAVGVDRAVDQLDLYGWYRWRKSCKTEKISPASHLRLAEAVVADYQHGINKYSITDVGRHAGIRMRHAHIMHFSAMQQRLLEAETVLANHLAKQLA